jgi:UDP-N-acetylmuramyl pentapeptide phosphotransferase/UDP-N-acetylglucosamine-1-phosphate transferase
MKIIVLLGVVFLISYAITLGIRIYSCRRNFTAVPNNRSLHRVPTPAIGGVAIVLTWYAGITLGYITERIPGELYFALLSGALLAVVSLADDIKTLKPGIRLFVHFATALVAFYFLGGIRVIEIMGTSLLPWYILYPLAIAGIVWFINIFNFLDGIDGYAAVEAICVSAAMLLITGDLINAILIASVLGFLVWNWPRARIFMGDVGSTQLGFILVVLGIYYHNHQLLSLVWWIILTSPFWFDATLTLFRRIRNREALSEAHSKHIYQRLVQSGFSHQKVDWLLILINAILTGLVYIFMKYEWMELVLMTTAIIMLYSLTIFTDKRKPFQPG